MLRTTLTTKQQGFFFQNLENLIDFEKLCRIIIGCKTYKPNKVKNGDQCIFFDGTHKGKSGIVQDLKTSKTGHVIITVLKNNGVRLNMLGKKIKSTRH